MFDKTLHIDLTLPKGWNQCTVSQLETIATVIMTRTAMSSAFHPVDMHSVKVDVFFALTGLEVVRRESKDGAPDEDACFLCRKKGIREMFPLYVWQVESFVNSELKWLGDDKAQGLLAFPYPTIRKRRFLKRHVYDGPATLMQDFTWERYRYAQDFMELYVLMSNKYIRMQRHPRQYTKKDLRLQADAVDKARGQFLATIYNGKVRHVDGSTGKTVREFAFTPSQASDNWRDFRDFDIVRWQVITLWWSGMMRYLKSKYKRCFKRQPTDIPQHSTTPLDLYTRTVATMEKYLGLDEETVNKQNFLIVLQHMEDMAQSNEEMEKIKKKKK